MMLRLILRGLAAHRLRLGLTALAVALGVGFVAGTMTYSSSLDSGIVQILHDSGKGTDTLIRAKKSFSDELGEQSPPQPVPASVLHTVAGLTGVAKVHGAARGFAAVVGRTGKPVGSPPQLGVDWTDDGDFSIGPLTRGRAPRTPGEVAVNVSTARAAGRTVGDRITVALRDGARPFTISGIFRYGASGSADGQVSVVAFEPGTAGRLLMERPGTYGEIAVHAAPGVSQERLRSTVARVLPGGLEAITGRQAIDERAKSVTKLLSVLRTLLLVFAGIAVFVGSFIIFNTFSMLVAQRKREMALLRAVGASRAQVGRLLMGEAAGLGLVGSTLGLALGALLSTGLNRLMLAVLGEALPSPGAPPASAVLWSYLVGVTVTVAAAYVPARRAGRIPPVAALRDDLRPARPGRVRFVTGGTAMAAGTGCLAAGLLGSGRTGVILVAAGAGLSFLGITVLSPVAARAITGVLGRPFARFCGAPGQLSSRNAQRNPGRTAATASALMIGLTLVGTVTVVTASVTASTDRQIDAGVVADYQVKGQNSVPLSPRVMDTVAQTPGVRSAVPVRTARLKLAGQVRTADAGNAAELARLYRLRIEAGTAPLGREELLVSRGTARAGNWRVGDTLPGEYQDGTPGRFRVAGIYADVTTILGTVPTMIVQGPRRGGDLIDRIEVTVAPGTGPRALESALLPWPNARLKDKATMKKDARSEVDILLSLVLALLVLSIVIAGLGIVNTLALSVVERTREVGLLRALGMQRQQVRRMVRYEAVVIAGYGALLGLGAGVAFGCAIQGAMAGQGMEVLAIPVGRLALYTAAGPLIGVLAAIWPARRAARTDVLRAIATD